MKILHEITIGKDIATFSQDANVNPPIVQNTIDGNLSLGTINSTNDVIAEKNAEMIIPDKSNIIVDAFPFSFAIEYAVITATSPKLKANPATPLYENESANPIAAPKAEPLATPKR